MMKITKTRTKQVILNTVSLIGAVLCFKIAHLMLQGKWVQYFSGVENEMAFTMLVSVMGVGLLINSITK